MVNRTQTVFQGDHLASVKYTVGMRKKGSEETMLGYYSAQVESISHPQCVAVFGEEKK